MNRIATLAAVALLGGTLPVVAQSSDRVAALRDAMASSGCIMTRQSRQAIVASTGLSDIDALGALTGLFAAPDAVADGDSFRLFTGACAGVGGEVPDRAALAVEREAVASAIVMLGCRLDMRRLSALAQDVGLSRPAVSGAVFGLVGRGEARFETLESPDFVVLTYGDCARISAIPPTAEARS